MGWDKLAGDGDGSDGEDDGDGDGDGVISYRLCLDP